MIGLAVQYLYRTGFTIPRLAIVRRFDYRFAQGLVGSDGWGKPLDGDARGCAAERR